MTIQNDVFFEVGSLGLKSRHLGSPWVCWSQEKHSNVRSPFSFVLLDLFQPAMVT